MWSCSSQTWKDKNVTNIKSSSSRCTDTFLNHRGRLGEGVTWAKEWVWLCVHKHIFDHVHTRAHTSSNCCFDPGWCSFSCSPCFFTSSVCFCSACLRCSSSNPAISCFLSNSFSISYFLNSSRLCLSTFSRSAVVWWGDNYFASYPYIHRESRYSSKYWIKPFWIFLFHLCLKL